MRRELFLNEMEAAMPWAVLLSVIEVHYPKQGKVGRPPKELSSMLRIHCMQHWLSCSDRQMEDALYEIESIRRFAGFGSVTESLPDERTISGFRHLLEQYELTCVFRSNATPHSD
ncbi:MAG: transposase, partial [Mariprofundaceae bacterium]|nr:transposase [Mariprofundaceae bacterium]